MKLIFTKEEDHQVTVLQEKDGQQKESLYVDMIRGLLDNGALASPELNGAFTDPEKVSINRIVDLINGVLESEEEEETVAPTS